MNLEEYLFKQRLGKSQFARLLGISPGYFYSILAGKQRASADLAIQIEQATKGKVKKEKLLFQIKRDPGP